MISGIDWFVICLLIGTDPLLLETRLLLSRDDESLALGKTSCRFIHHQFSWILSYRKN